MNSSQRSAGGAGTAAQVAEARVWAEEVGSALAALDQRDAAALSLVYANRLTQSQVAAQLGIPKREASTRIARGLRVMAGVLDLDSDRRKAARLSGSSVGSLG